MHRLFLILLASPIFSARGWAVLLVSSFLFCHAVCAEEVGFSPQITSQIDALFEPFDHPGSPGYALGIVKNGHLVFQRGYGRADLDHNLPITAQTAFHLASLSKQFTAAAIALLILDGKLDLETPLAKFYPETAAFAPDLRIKHLIYFTSGLRDYKELKRSNGEPWFSAYYFTTDEAVAATLASKSLKFPPGTKWDYSNVNYMLLAKVVEQISGQTLAQFLATRIFGPLQMNNSLLNDDTTQVIPNRATGYAPRADPVLRKAFEDIHMPLDPGSGYARMVRNSPHYGGSGVFSTLEDLAKWDENFDSNRLAGPEFTALMLKRMKFQHDKDNDAFGLVHGSYKNHDTVWFSGGDLDSSTCMIRVPDEHLTVICLSNIWSGDAEKKADLVLDLLLQSRP